MDSITWLKQLISFDTTSAYSNLDLINALQAWFEQHHIATQLSFNESKQKANLIASIAADHQQNTKGLLLSGHSDVVPVAGQQWDSDPFTAVIKNDRIYGRGACDMKGFLAVMLALAPELSQLKLNKPIHMAFSYDEEVGCLGAPILIESMLQNGIQADACVVGEPTDMCPVIAHKGIHVFKCSVKGCSAHSSLTTQACNAIEYAAQLITELRKLVEKLRDENEQDQDFIVPFTTLSSNMIQGGFGLNIIPDRCEFFFEIRNLPQFDPKSIITAIKAIIAEKILPQMQAEYAAANIELENLAAVPSMHIETTEKIVQLVQSLTHNHQQNKVAYATEAGLFQRAGIPTIICGPGSIEQAHRANEFIEISQLKLCEQFIRDLVSAYAIAD